jgi:hypothetical protein
MSPKEQATAAKLLRRWLTQHADPPAPELLDVNVWIKVLEELQAETQAFLEHEDPDA